MSAKRTVRQAGPIVRGEKRLPDQSCLRFKRDVCGGIQATVLPDRCPPNPDLVCSRSGYVHPYFWRRRGTTSRSDRFGQGWSAHEPDTSELGRESIKLPDRMVGGFDAVGISGLFFRWYEPCHMISSFRIQRTK
jgi:hypothetical protein